MVTAIGSRSVRTMLDCSAAGRMESAPLPALVDSWLPNGMIAHVQVNDRNRRGPGQGEQRFAPRPCPLLSVCLAPSSWTAGQELGSWWRRSSRNSCGSCSLNLFSTPA